MDKFLGEFFIHFLAEEIHVYVDHVGAGVEVNIPDFLGKLSSVTLWKRIGVVAAGLLILILGFVLLLGSNKSVQGIAKVAAV